MAINNTPRDPRIRDRVPKTVTDLRVLIIKYNDSVVDITKECVEISIYESIYTPFLYGEIIMGDNSSIIATFPMIGQEKVRIEWKKNGQDSVKEFYVTDVFDVQQHLEGIGSFGISITSEKQMRNAITLFSKSYKGRGDEIIQNVFEEHLRDTLTVNVKAKTSHSVVFPYMKPLAAVNMIQKSVLAEDGTPMFLFESLYGDAPGAVLDSYKRMYDQEPVFEIEPVKTTNRDADNGDAQRGLSNLQGQVYQFSITKGYDTLDQMTKGAYGATAIVVDASDKTAAVTEFSFRKHAGPVAKDWISEFFAFDNIRVDKQYNTKLFYVPQNKLAFCKDDGTLDFPNINSTDDELDSVIISSYMNRINTTNVAIHMNSVPDLEVGKTINYTFPRFSPKLNKNEDTYDKVNSGKYLISAIRHYIKNSEYTMSIELIRDGIGQEAELYPNNRTPDFGKDPVTRVSVLSPIK